MIGEMLRKLRLNAVICLGAVWETMKLISWMRFEQSALNTGEILYCQVNTFNKITAFLSTCTRTFITLLFKKNCHFQVE
jgi:hypothetical protein